MSFDQYLSYIRRILALIPFNVFDYIVGIIFLIYVFEDASFGLIPAGLSLISTLSAFLIGLLFYYPVSALIVKNFSLTKGISDAIAFLFITGFSFVLISGILALIKKRYLNFSFPKEVNVIGGAIFGFLSFFFIASFAVALLLSFPVSNVIKESVRQSVSGKFLFTKTQGLESEVRKVFGGAIEDTINFLTIKPGSNQTVSLNFKVKDGKIDKSSENRMLALVNAEREKAGLSPLEQNERLAEAARGHAKDMLAKGYFSHYTPEGLSPFDRMAMYSINYQFAGENLAFAPDVQIAMDGLMKSQGHRENILSPNFGKAGIGVIDAGIFGKMFVQEFTD